MSVKKITTYLSTAAVALALGALVTSSTANAGDGTKLEARMDNPDFTIASCKAKWENDGGRTRLSVECEDTGAVSAVFLGCNDSLGLPDVPLEVDTDFDLNLDTSDGEDVPACAENGSAAVDLTDANNDVTNVSGTFELK